MRTSGIIIRQKSNLYTVYSNGREYDCRARGKFRQDKLTPLVGDFVVFDDEDKYILELTPRKNELSRPPIANVDAALIVTSVKKPNFSLPLLDKEIACILFAHIEPIIVLTKMDLLNREELRSVKKTIKYYSSIGFKVLDNRHLFRLKRILKGKTVVLTGQTGAGKSTLLNKLDKSLSLETNEISEALGRGVHTTRHTEIYNVKGIRIADTPGFSALDLTMPKDELKGLYPEFNGAECKYADCNHIKEKGCSVKKAYDDGKILASRYENYVKFWGELK